MPKIADLPINGALTDASSLAGATASGAGGRFTAAALRDYVVAAIGTALRLSDAAPAGLGPSAQAGTATAAARADHVHARPSLSELGAAPASHTHDIAGVTGLSTALAGKAALDHSHAISGVTGLQAALDAKQAASAKGQANGYASLDATARLPAAQLPANAVTTSHLAAVSDFSSGLSATQAHNNGVMRYVGSAAVTVTLPALSIGTTIRYIQRGAGKITFVAGSGATLNSLGGLLSTAGQHASVTATVETTGQWNLSGALAA